MTPTTILWIVRAILFVAWFIALLRFIYHFYFISKRIPRSVTQSMNTSCQRW